MEPVKLPSISVSPFHSAAILCIILNLLFPGIFCDRCVLRAKSRHYERMELTVWPIF